MRTVLMNEIAYDIAVQTLRFQNGNPGVPTEKGGGAMKRQAKFTDEVMLGLLMFTGIARSDETWLECRDSKNWKLTIAIDYGSRLVSVYDHHDKLMSKVTAGISERTIEWAIPAYNDGGPATYLCRTPMQLSRYSGMLAKKAVRPQLCSNIRVTSHAALLDRPARKF
jgi:hypothetical protein